MSFKDRVLKDVKNVFLNTDEFAENHDVIYDGKTYEKIPVVLENNTMTENPNQGRRDFKTTTQIDGIYISSITAFIALEDLGGVIPEQNSTVEIDDGEALGKPFFRKYNVLSSACDMGMITLELRMYDE